MSDEEQIKRLAARVANLRTCITELMMGQDWQRMWFSSYDTDDGWETIDVVSFGVACSTLDVAYRS